MTPIILIVDQYQYHNVKVNKSILQSLPAPWVMADLTTLLSTYVHSYHYNESYI
jgi:hypothetical protein